MTFIDFIEQVREKHSSISIGDCYTLALYIATYHPEVSYEHEALINRLDQSGELFRILCRDYFSNTISSILDYSECTLQTDAFGLQLLKIEFPEEYADDDDYMTFDPIISSMLVDTKDAHFYTDNYRKRRECDVSSVTVTATVTEIGAQYFNPNDLESARIITEKLGCTELKNHVNKMLESLVSNDSYFKCTHQIKRGSLYYFSDYNELKELGEFYSWESLIKDLDVDDRRCSLLLFQDPNAFESNPDYNKYNKPFAVYIDSKYNSTDDNILITLYPKCPGLSIYQFTVRYKYEELCILYLWLYFSSPHANKRRNFLLKKVFPDLGIIDFKRSDTIRSLYTIPWI